MGGARHNNHNGFFGVIEILWNGVEVTAQSCKYIKTKLKYTNRRDFLWYMNYVFKKVRAVNVLIRFLSLSCKEHENSIDCG